MATGSRTTVSVQVYPLPPTGNTYPGQTAPSNDQPRAANAPTMLSNGFVVTPAVTVASNGAEPALQLPNSALISAGGLPAVVSGKTYSVFPSNQGLLVNGASTLSIPQLPSTSPSLSIITMGRQAFTASPGGFPPAAPVSCQADSHLQSLALSSYWGRERCGSVARQCCCPQIQARPSQ